MGLESVGGLAMHVILSKLGPLEAASVACLGKRFRVWASDDSLWAQFCFHDLNLTSPLDPYGNRTPSFKVFLSLGSANFFEHVVYLGFYLWNCC